MSDGVKLIDYLVRASEDAFQNGGVRSTLRIWDDRSNGKGICIQSEDGSISPPIIFYAHLSLLNNINWKLDDRNTGEIKSIWMRGDEGSRLDKETIRKMHILYRAIIEHIKQILYFKMKSESPKHTVEFQRYQSIAEQIMSDLLQQSSKDNITIDDWKTIFKKYARKWHPDKTKNQQHKMILLNQLNTWQHQNIKQLYRHIKQKQS